MTSARLMSAAFTIIAAAFLLAYFGRTHNTRVELVTPQQESATYHARYPSDMNLANRVMKSYDLAFILVQSPYLSKNVAALETVREWARDQFQAHPDFLHPVSLPAEVNQADTIFGALTANALAVPRAWCESAVCSWLRKRISEFHTTTAFGSFNKAFFDVFGNDADAAILLAKYESDRAKQAIPVVVWSILWVCGAAMSCWYLAINRHRDLYLFGCVRKVTACCWAIMAAAYLCQSWTSGHAAVLLSALLAAALSAYLWRPMVFLSHNEVRQQLVHIRLAPCWIALAAWFTCTSLCVQVLAWIRVGSQVAPDPISLLVGTITGNFVHEPVQEKHLVSTIVIWLWLLMTVWTVSQRSKNQAYTEPDDSFETLQPARQLESSR